MIDSHGFKIILLLIQGMFKYLPLMSVRNSSCLTFPAARSIFKAKSRVKVILSFSYRPRTAYLNTSKVMYSIMFVMRFWVIGDFVDLKSW